jgi:hypothetical protein
MVNKISISRISNNSLRVFLEFFVEELQSNQDCALRSFTNFRYGLALDGTTAYREPILDERRLYEYLAEISTF